MTAGLGNGAAAAPGLMTGAEDPDAAGCVEPCSQLSTATLRPSERLSSASLCHSPRRSVDDPTESPPPLLTNLLDSLRLLVVAAVNVGRGPPEDAADSAADAS